MKILLLDIETAPNLAYVWKLWDVNVGLDMHLEEHYMLCWAAKWLGEDKVFFSSKYNTSRKKMLKPLKKMLDDADIVITYNGIRFDIPHINREFLESGITPPSPYKQLDLMHTVKRQFNFPSNKLDYVCNKLGIGKKVKHIGFPLWEGCIQNDEGSWRQMQEYNIQDTELLQELYYSLRPWIKNHPNVSVILNETTDIICPKCGGTHHHKRGFYTATSSRYQRYQCQECHSWFRDTTILNRKVNKTVNIT